MKCLLVLLICVAVTLSHRRYQGKIPNGDKVPHPCNPSTVWNGVGHWNELGGGMVNAFGEAFAANNHIWSWPLCNADSDGDGMTNGEELGDPSCIWTPANNIALETPKGHPGICEPVGSPGCSLHAVTCS